MDDEIFSFSINDILLDIETDEQLIARAKRLNQISIQSPIKNNAATAFIRQCLKRNMTLFQWQTLISKCSFLIIGLSICLERRLVNFPDTWRQQLCFQGLQDNIQLIFYLKEADLSKELWIKITHENFLVYTTIC